MRIYLQLGLESLLNIGYTYSKDLRLIPRAFRFRLRFTVAIALYHSDECSYRYLGDIRREFLL
jgi:hypothetical protein